MKSEPVVELEETQIESEWIRAHAPVTRVESDATRTLRLQSVEDVGLARSRAKRHFHPQYCDLSRPEEGARAAVEGHTEDLRVCFS